MSFSLRNAAKAAFIFDLFTLSALVSAKNSGDVTELQIVVKYKPQFCEMQAHMGDRINVHYRVGVLFVIGAGVVAK